MQRKEKRSFCLPSSNKKLIGGQPVQRQRVHVTFSIRDDQIPSYVLGSEHRRQIRNVDIRDRLPGHDQTVETDLEFGDRRRRRFRTREVELERIDTSAAREGLDASFAQVLGSNVSFS